MIKMLFCSLSIFHIRLGNVWGEFWSFPLRFISKVLTNLGWNLFLKHLTALLSFYNFHSLQLLLQNKLFSVFAVNPTFLPPFKPLSPLHPPFSPLTNLLWHKRLLKRYNLNLLFYFFASLFFVIRMHVVVARRKGENRKSLHILFSFFWCKRQNRKLEAWRSWKERRMLWKF